MAWDWGDSQVLGALNGGGAKNVEEGGVAHVHEVAEHAPEDVLDDGVGDGECLN